MPTCCAASCGSTRKQPEAARRDFGLAKDIALQLPPGEEQSHIMTRTSRPCEFWTPRLWKCRPPLPGGGSARTRDFANTGGAVNSTADNVTVNATVMNTTVPPVNGTAGNNSNP